MSTLSSSINKFSNALDNIISHNISLDSKQDNIIDFSQKKKAYKINMYKTSFRELINNLGESNNQEMILSIDDLKSSFEENNLGSLKQQINRIAELSSRIEPVKKPSTISFNIRNLPSEISTEVKADLNELENCFKSSCYRASVILCGRILETALHSKYYLHTGRDILEKNPGIGLGTLVAKMKDKGILLDPAINQQIHLINQVRIYSVHKKKEAFQPNKDQTHAIILYTTDIIKKLFSS